MKALRRAQVAWCDRSPADDQPFQHNARIDHANLKDMEARCADVDIDRHAAYSVVDRLAPVFVGVMGESIDHLCGLISMEMAKRRPRPGTKFSVGARVTSTLNAPLSKSHMRYSSVGAGLARSMLGAVTGKTLIPESVRPKPGILSQFTPLAPVFPVKCSASIETYWLASTKPSAESGTGATGLKDFTCTRIEGPVSCRRRTEPFPAPLGTLVQSILTQSRTSLLTIPDSSLR